MIPYGGDLMDSSPKDPVNDMRECKRKAISNPKKNADVSLAQPRKPRPFLKSSRLDEDGLCCWMVSLSPEL